MITLSHSSVAVFIVASGAALVYYSYARQQTPARNPPGPRPLPLIGNLLHFPRERMWVTFANWKKQYGDVVYINMLGTDMVILNSLEACKELLDKRSVMYSGRPISVMLVELMGFDYGFPSMTYSSRWRRHRRLFHQYFNENAVLQYRPNQEHSIHNFLQRLLTEPKEFLKHVRLLFGETILDIVYDIQAEDDSGAFVQAAETAMDVFLEAAIPGQFLVDVFPAMKHIPSWFPGGGFRKRAAEWRDIVFAPRDLPFAYAKKKIDNGTAAPSVLTSMLERSDKILGNKEAINGETAEDIIKACAAISYLGGADTTLSSVQTIFMVMANYPEVQRAAQAELDAVLGASPKRLPSFTDKEDLPYINAIIKEHLRWHNVLPLGVPHVLTEDDDIYDGYTIRKGTVVFANIWHILHDAERYPDPFTFNPQRWLINTPKGFKPNPDIPDPNIAVFGYGRRTCPGRHFALNSLFIVIASVLYCFNIRPTDEDGKATAKVREAFSSGLISYPLPYNVTIIPRSEHHAQLIKQKN